MAMVNRRVAAATQAASWETASIFRPSVALLRFLRYAFEPFQLRTEHVCGGIAIVALARIDVCDDVLHSCSLVLERPPQFGGRASLPRRDLGARRGCIV